MLATTLWYVFALALLAALGLESAAAFARASVQAAADHARWTNVFFAEQGLFTLQTAYGIARHSR